MKILIDLQACQSESRYRGIGRYSMSLAKAIARNAKNHDILILLNDSFLDTVEEIKNEFKDLIPKNHIYSFSSLSPTAEIELANQPRARVSEVIREYAIEQIKPDIVHIMSLFEGFGDDAITSIGKFSNIPTSVILHDLIPYIRKEVLNCHPNYKDYYFRKIDSLKKSDLLLANSESSKKEAVKYLGIREEKIITIGTAVDDSFRKIDLTDLQKQKILEKYNIKKPFIMYSPGGFDPRKNVTGLIKAFSILDKPFKEKYQLVVTSKIQEGDKNALKRTADKYGLKEDDLILTGYVSDEDLISLYNLCELFVFPSLHEGFGLPALEAMACGAAVIGSRATSIPEVIGRDDALFDPHDPKSIAFKVKEGLTNTSFREDLKKHALIQAKNFSWDKSAQLAIKAFEKLYNATISEQTSRYIYLENTSIFKTVKKKILVLKLDHRGDFILAIPALSKLRNRYPYSDIDIIVADFNRPIAESLGFFRNIYTLNFFKSVSQEPPSIIREDINLLLNNLEHYDIAIDLRRQPDTRFLLSEIKANLKVGYKTFNNNIDKKLDIVIPSYPDMPRIITPLNNTSISEQMLRIIDSIPNDINDFIYLPNFCGEIEKQISNIAIFPFAGNNIKEWEISNYIALIKLLDQDNRIKRINIYVTSTREAEKFATIESEKISIHIGLEFKQLVESLSSNAICVSNNSFGAHLASYMGIISIGIYSGHETFEEWGPVFNSAFVIHRNAECSPCHLPRKEDCGDNFYCLRDISVEFVYKTINEAIDLLINNNNDLLKTNPSNKNKNIIEELTKLNEIHILNENQLLEVAQKIALNTLPYQRLKQIFVDISELSVRDAKSGIQRVVKAQLYELFKNHPEGYNIEPIYLTDEGGFWHYRYARNFMTKFLDLKDINLEDELIDFYPGDIFYAPDLFYGIIEAQKQRIYTKMRAKNVSINFLVHDILPITHPEVYLEGAYNTHKNWVDTIANVSDKLICTSKAVEDQLIDYLKLESSFIEGLAITHIHLGANFDSSLPTKGLPNNSKDILQKLISKPTFLMVGTIEPRKGHVQTIKAFEILWSKGIDVNLAIVGKNGWMVDDVIKKIKTHSELNKRLFWPNLDLTGESISDEYLEEIYKSSKCLIAASIDEGFGLPLIEAAQHKLPIIARDIPVFREVAGEYAYYFEDSKEPEVISDAVKSWLALYREDKHPKSDNMPWITWEENVKQLLDVLLR